MAGKGRAKNVFTRFWLGNLLEGDNFEGPRVDLKIIDGKRFGFKA